MSAIDLRQPVQLAVGCLIAFRVPKAARCLKSALGACQSRESQRQATDCLSGFSFGGVGLVGQVLVVGRIAATSRSGNACSDSVEPLHRDPRATQRNDGQPGRVP